MSRAALPWLPPNHSKRTLIHSPTSHLKCQQSLWLLQTSFPFHTWQHSLFVPGAADVTRAASISSAKDHVDQCPMHFSRSHVCVAQDTKRTQGCRSAVLVALLVSDIVHVHSAKCREPRIVNAILDPRQFVAAAEKSIRSSHIHLTACRGPTRGSLAVRPVKRRCSSTARGKPLYTCLHYNR